MRSYFRIFAIATCLLGVLFTSGLRADEVASPKPKSAKESGIRLLNTKFFSKSADEPIVVLQKSVKDTVAPESVFLDIDDEGTYYAATVRYPLKLGLERVRTLLNKEYGKWEMKDFAKDPTMGIWRNEKEKFSIQLSEDADNVVVIYISFERVPADRIEKAVDRFVEELSKESEE
ncbi:hypothetical protein [Aeoliella sp.]|uniref:hypothetical protein n=1 Tax=Aeoliella sp. TaxID=2795800 RepID=UPI003CCC3015